MYVCARETRKVKKKRGEGRESERKRERRK